MKLDLFRFFLGALFVCISVAYIWGTAASFLSSGVIILVALFVDTIKERL